MTYTKQVSALDRLIGVRLTLEDADKSEAVENQEYLAAAWDVVVEHEPLVHFVLKKRHIDRNSNLVDYEEAVSYLTEALFDCCWTYNPYAPNSAKFSTFVIQSLSLKFSRFLDLEARKKMPYYIPLNVTPDWIDKRTEAIQEDLKKKLNSTDEFRYDSTRDRKLMDSAAKKMSHVVNAQWSMNARPVNVKRFSVGEAGEYDERTIDPLDLAPDNPEHTTPYSDPVFDAVAHKVSIRDIDRVMNGCLSDREAKVLRLRYGVGTWTGEPQTLEQIAQYFSLTRERIRQIERKALGKIRIYSDPQVLELLRAGLE